MSSKCFEHFSRNPHRLGDVGFGVGSADKTGFVQSGRDVDTAIQQAVEQLVELGAVAGHDLGVVLRQLGQQEETKHAALAVGAEGHTRIGRCTFESVDQALGAGDTLTAALAALLATGMDLPEATSEALHYLDRCLDEGFRPGMGQVIPDRLFWALPEGEETDDDGPEVHPGADYFEVPFNETKH